MALRTTLAAVLACGLALIGFERAAVAEDPEAALRAGRYDEAIAGFEQESKAHPSDVAARRGLVRSLAEVGRYEEAEKAARAFRDLNPRSVELHNALGEVLVTRGRLGDAEAAFKAALSGRTSDALTAEVNLAELRLARGERDAALRPLSRLIDAYNREETKTAEDLIAVGRACRLLGLDEPQLFKDALKAFDEATEADGSNLEAKVRAGNVLLEKYQSAEAKASFEEVLAKNPRHPEALLGLARARDFDDEMGVVDLLKESLKVNSSFAPALAYFASVHVSLEEYARATEEANQALAINPVSMDALASLAAAAYLRGDKAGFEAARDRALQVNPRASDFFSSVAEACVRNRLYREADGFAEKAVALDPRDWHALGVLGLNRLRLGRIEEGRQALETAFKGDPYHIWIKNTLDLLDTFPKYRETTSEHFRVFVHQTESELLAPYVTPLAEEALRSLSERYRYRPETPIRVEMYPHHPDFSVRTVGLSGLGALGVCFGSVVALDSPSARELGKANWGSTLWHELAHSVTLGLSGFRVPRWLTEGISVYEERRARPGWGDDLSLEFLVAMKAGKLLPLRTLNNGFQRPEGPEQVALSYYQASLVVELIDKEIGTDAVIKLLQAYRDGLTTEAAFPKALGRDVEAVDSRFQAWLQEKYGPRLKVVRVPDKSAPAPTLESLRQTVSRDPDDFLARALLGRVLFEQKKREEAEPHLQKAIELFPESGGDESPYWPLALIKKDQGKTQEAADLLSKLVAINENHYAARLELSALLDKLGDPKRAAALLTYALYIHAAEATLHERRAGLCQRLGDLPCVLSARQSLVALGPVDRAEALYQLAAAYFAAGDVAGARREVLRALEVAPRFERAQELLLKLHRGVAAKP
jgi:tetratricopeptide (TPR) repeat protein